MNWSLFKNKQAAARETADARTEKLEVALEAAIAAATAAIEPLVARAAASAQLFAKTGLPGHATAEREDAVTSDRVSSWHGSKIAALRQEFETANAESQTLYCAALVTSARDVHVARQESAKPALAQLRIGLATLGVALRESADRLAESNNLLRIEGETATAEPIDEYARGVLEGADHLAIQRAKEVLHARDGITFQQSKSAAFGVLLDVQHPLIEEPFSPEAIAALETLLAHAKESASRAVARKGLHAMAVSEAAAAQTEAQTAGAGRLEED